jgi:hypothetical protein
MFASGRYCCKSPKLPGANFSAVKKSDRRTPVDVASITLPRSPASLSSGDEVPQIFTRKSRVQPKEILITSAKRLLQQSAHRVDSLRCEGSDAIGAKRTCRERRERVDLTKMTPMYGPAVRCKRVSSIWRTCDLASMYPASDWSVLCSEPSWISARVRSYYRTGLEWAIWVTSVRMRR